jgi:hypothetical protein
MTTVDPFLCVGMAILLAVLLVINVYMLVMWQHPDDKVNQIFFFFIYIIYIIYY